MPPPPGLITFRKSHLQSQQLSSAIRRALCLLALRPLHLLGTFLGVRDTSICYHIPVGRYPYHQPCSVPGPNCAVPIRPPALTPTVTLKQWPVPRPRTLPDPTPAPLPAVTALSTPSSTLWDSCLLQNSLQVHSAPLGSCSVPATLPTPACSLLHCGF